MNDDNAFSREVLETVLLTTDGAGKDRKREALDRLLRQQTSELRREMGRLHHVLDGVLNGPDVTGSAEKGHALLEAAGYTYRNSPPAP